MTTSSYLPAAAQAAPRRLDVRRPVTIAATAALIIAAGVAWHLIIGTALGAIR